MPRQKTKRTKSARGASDQDMLQEEQQQSKRPKRTARKSARKPKIAFKKFRRIKFAAIAAGILAVFALYTFDIDTVTTNAMQPALNKGDLVLSYSPLFPKCSPQPGDIVLLPPNIPTDAAPNFLRTVATGPGTISFVNDEITIDGRKPSRLELTNPAISRPENPPEIWRETLHNGAEYRIMLPRDPIDGARTGTSNLETGQIFLVGDNRMASYDSRQTGAIAQSDIRGCALFVLRSANDDGILSHWIKPIR